MLVSDVRGNRVWFGGAECTCSSYRYSTNDRVRRNGSACGEYEVDQRYMRIRSARDGEQAEDTAENGIDQTEAGGRIAIETLDAGGGEASRPIVGSLAVHLFGGNLFTLTTRRKLKIWSTKRSTTTAE